MTSSRTKQGARRDKHEPLPLKTNNTTGDPSRDYLLIPRTDRCFFQSPLNWGMNSALCWPQMKRKSSLETLLPGCLWSRLNRPCSASEIGRVLPSAEAARAGALCTRAPRTVKLQLCCSVFSDHVTSNVFSSTANSGYILVRQSR